MARGRRRARRRARRRLCRPAGRRDSHAAPELPSLLLYQRLRAPSPLALPDPLHCGRRPEHVAGARRVCAAARAVAPHLVVAVAEPVHVHGVAARTCDHANERPVVCQHQIDWHDRRLAVEAALHCPCLWTDAARTGRVHFFGAGRRITAILDAPERMP